MAASSPSIVSKFIDYIRVEEDLDNKTVNNLKGYLSTFFNFFINHEETLIKNPTVKIEKLNEEDSDQHPAYTREQWNAINALCQERGEEQLLYICQVYFLPVYKATPGAAAAKGEGYIYPVSIYSRNFG